MANKIDLSAERVVSTEEGKGLAETKRWEYIETSCKEGTNTTEAFVLIARQITKMRKHQQKLPSKRCIVM